MLKVSPVDFYISSIVIAPTLEKIDATINRFNEVIEEIKKDERFKDVLFNKPRMKHRYKEEEVIASTQIRWYSSASPELIEAFIEHWNEVDNKNPLSVFYFHHLYNAM